MPSWYRLDSKKSAFFCFALCRCPVCAIEHSYVNRRQVTGLGRSRWCWSGGVWSWSVLTEEGKEYKAIMHIWSNTSWHEKHDCASFRLTGWFSQSPWLKVSVRSGSMNPELLLSNMKSQIYMYRLAAPSTPTLVLLQRWLLMPEFHSKCTTNTSSHDPIPG